MEQVIMKPGDDYYGLHDMIKADRIHNAQKLNMQINIEIMFTIVFKKHKLINNTLKKYFIIRAKDKNAIKIIFEKIKNYLDYNKIIFNKKIIKFDMKDTSSINYHINDEPKIMTFIFVINKLRMGITTNTINVCCVYEYCNKGESYCASLVQSLVGRCCGYNKKDHNVIIFSNLKHITDHIKWIDNNYNKKYIPDSVKYIDKPTKKQNKII